jgi:DNA mismatch endonuclease (patch repair protein)
VDPLSADERSRVMKAVHARDTTPERVVRSIAHRLGLRFRLCVAKLPGSPDLVFARHGVVIFVHGCFWHHHSCTRGTIPQTRTEFWLSKFQANKKRDRSNRVKLERSGWRVAEIWECETKDQAGLERKLRRLFMLGAGG